MKISFSAAGAEPGIFSTSYLWKKGMVLNEYGWLLDR
jgi:hypothetical protein